MVESNNNNKFYMGNQNLKRNDFEETITEEEMKHRISEIKKCRDDVLYFADKYFYIVSPDEGKHIINLFDKQKTLIRSFQDYKRCVVLASRQTGKCHTVETLYTVRRLKSDGEYEVRILTAGEFHKLSNR